MSGTKKTNSVDFGYLGDKKVEKGKKNILEAANGWKGSSHKERQVEQREIKRVSKKEAALHMSKVSWRKRTAGLCAIFFICGAGLFQFISTVWQFIRGSGMVVLDVHDTAKLKGVLFGGNPWLVYCVNNETQSHRLPKVLEDSASTLWSDLGLKVGVLQCWDQTASGRSVAQRFKLPLKPPLSFVVANGNKPRILTLVGLATAEDIEKKVKPALTIQHYRIDTLKKWGSLCTSRRSCVVVGHKQNAQRDTVLNVLRPLMESYRAVKFVTLDTSFWQLKLDQGLMATRNIQGRGGADVVCITRNEGSSGGGVTNATHSGRFLQSLDSSSASAFLAACDKQEDLVTLKATPRIKARPSKPKKASAAPLPPSPRPPSKPAAAPAKHRRGNVDHVGSRAHMESEDEMLFEAVEEEEEPVEDGTGGDSDEESNGDNVGEEETSEDISDEVEL